MFLSEVTEVSDGVITSLCMLLVAKSLIYYEGGTQKLNDKIKVDEILIELINLIKTSFHIVIIKAIIIHH